VAPVGWSAQAARAMRPAGPRRIRPEADFQLRIFFLFQICFINYKSSLNFNDFYSHNKIQEHFITPRKICNGMNATNKYLFKYISLQNSILFKNQGVTAADTIETYFVVTDHLRSRHQRLDFIYGSGRYKQPTLKIYK
jgi:hypothetical protein